MISRFAIFLSALVLTSSAHAIDLGVGFGPFLPSRVGYGVREVLNGWGSRVGFATSKGAFEIEYFNAHGSGVNYHTVAFDFRLDVKSDGALTDVPAFLVLGMHADSFSPLADPAYPDRDLGYRYTGGWHYGGGFRVPIFGKESGAAVRADFKHRFGPGNSLIVLVGFSFMTGSGSSGTP